MILGYNIQGGMEGERKSSMVRNLPHDHEYLSLRQNMPVYLHYTLCKRQITRINSAPNVTQVRFLVAGIVTF